MYLIIRGYRRELDPVREVLLLILLFLIHSHTISRSPIPDRIWGTYYGGSGNEVVLSMCLDPEGNLLFCGETNSQENIATPGSQQPVFGGSYDGFLCKFTSAGQRLWGTFYGGAYYDYGVSASIDPAGDIYLSGYTQSPNQIASSGSHQGSLAGLTDGYLVKFTEQPVAIREQNNGHITILAKSNSRIFYCFRIISGSFHTNSFDVRSLRESDLSRSDWVWNLSKVVRPSPGGRVFFDSHHWLCAFTSGIFSPDGLLTPT